MPSVIEQPMPEKDSVLYNLKRLIKIAIATGGAGTLGSIEVGAHTALQDNSYIPGEVIGTSAGSITSAMRAIGTSNADCLTIVLSADYKKLIDYRIWGIWNSLASPKNVNAWLKDITSNKRMGDVLIPLKTISSDTYDQDVMIWDSNIHKDMFIADAVYSSMAIPDVFPPYLNRYADGGMLANLPINYLNSAYPRIGLNVHEFTPKGPISGLFQRNLRLLSMLLSANVETIKIWSKAVGVPIINLPAHRLGFLDRSMTKDQKMDLYYWGYNAVMEYCTNNKLV